MPTQYANVYRNLIAHYIGLSTNGNGVAAILTETYRPLYRAVYHDCSFINTLDIILIAHYIGLSTTYSKTAGFRWIILIAHYIGLSTESSMHDLNKILLILSPIISGCLHCCINCSRWYWCSYRPLYRAVYFPSTTRRIGYQSLSPIISGCLLVAQCVPEREDVYLIAHYIGLSTILFTLLVLTAILAFLSPIISGCLQILSFIQ